MSLGNAISMALFSVIMSYGTGITETTCSHADGAVYNSAEVAQERWHKRDLTWAVMNVSVSMSRRNVEDMMAEAFAKWAQVSPFKFRKISREYKPDIRIEFGLMKEGGFSVVKFPEGNVLDYEGVDITFDSARNWTNIFGFEYFNFRYIALHETGRALGLNSTSNSRAVMYKGSHGALVNGEPYLGGDDILGIRALYGGGSASSGSASRMYGHRKPVSSSSSSTSSSSG